MTEQQYRVIADRHKGDDPQSVTPREGDLITYRFDGRVHEGHGTALIRIERPVPKCEHGRIVFYVEDNETRCVKCGAVILDGEPVERPVPTTGLPAPMTLTAAEQDSYTAAMDEEPLFQSADYDFEMFDDGSWKCWADGAVVANGAFSRRDMNALAEDLIRVERSLIGLYDNDRYGDQ